MKVMAMEVKLVTEPCLSLWNTSGTPAWLRRSKCSTICWI